MLERNRRGMLVALLALGSPLACSGGDGRPACQLASDCLTNVCNSDGYCCSAESQPCARSAECCGLSSSGAPLSCHIDEEDDSSAGTCQACVPRGGQTDYGDSCCSRVGDGAGNCACAALNGSCSTDFDCCVGTCRGDTCLSCSPRGGACQVDDDCCSHSCMDNVCQCIPGGGTAAVFVGGPGLLFRPGGSVHRFVRQHDRVGVHDGRPMWA